MRITKQVLQVLGIFLKAPSQAMSGSDIRKKTGLATGSLYPILLRLERANWLQSEWETIDPSEAGRPRKRYYLLTKTGFHNAQAEFNLLLGGHNNGLVSDHPQLSHSLNH